MNITRLLFLFFLLSFLPENLTAQPVTDKPGKRKKPEVIAYYAGDPVTMDSFPVEKLTQIIFCFCHLEGNRMHISNARDSSVIQNLVLLKKRNPGLKVLMSLGGWGGCYTCSPVFSSPEGRNEFAKSVKELNDYFHTDGIDLDWEYPAIQGPPDHPFSANDKSNFTALLQVLRQTLGKKNQISFAAGGFTSYLEYSVEWNKVIPLVNRVNLMTYDLVHGYSTVTGHHTALFSTPGQKESVDHAVNYLLSIGVPAGKLVIGAAFYARVFEGVENINNGLYQPGHFRNGVSYKDFEHVFSGEKGFLFLRDSVAAAPFLYNRTEKLFVTFDDSVSIDHKTRYAISRRLNGIMFWQLMDDKRTNGLLDVIGRSGHR
jgi:chitinase